MPSTTTRASTFGLTAAVGLSLAGCISSLPASKQEAAPTASQQTTVVIAPDDSHVLPFALRDGRVTEAARRLQGVLGHDVQIQVDAALVPAERERFIQALAGAIDNAAIALEDERGRSPNAFMRSAPLLRVIACRYDTVSDYVRSGFDEATGTLKVRLPGFTLGRPDAASRPLFEAVVVEHAIEGAYSAWLYTKFDGVEPRQVDPADRSFYADYRARMARTSSSPRHSAPASPGFTSLVR